MFDIDEFSNKRQELLDGIATGAFIRADILPSEELYHYTSLEGFQSILETRIFRATEFHYLNDEDEFTYIDKLVFKIIDEEFRGTTYYKELKQAFAENMMSVRIDSEELTNSYYVVSFSKSPDNLTLWTEFASFGCNMAVLPFDLFTDTSQIAYCGSVVYDETEQKELVKSAMRMVLSHFTDMPSDGNEDLRIFLDGRDEQEIRLMAEPILRLVAHYGMVMKNGLYQAEDEYRIVFQPDGKKTNYRLKGSLLIPYIELPLLLEATNPALKAVTLAPLNKSLLHRKSMAQFLYGRGLNSVEVKESMLNLRY